MHLLPLLLLTGTLYQETTGGLYLRPYNPCEYGDSHKHDGFEHFEHFNPTQTNFETQNHSNAFPNLPGNVTLTPINPKTEEAIVPKGNVKESEIVGLAGLAHLHALKARAKARAFVSHARARLHHPLLLQTTPQDYLDEPQNLLKQIRVDNNLQIADPPSSMAKVKPNNFEPGTHTRNSEFSHNFDDEDEENDETGPTVVFPSLEVALPESLENVARSVGYSYENGQHESPAPAVPVVNYDEQAEVQQYDGQSPEIYIHNIDNRDEVYGNRKPGFSIIPTNWKPPPQSNLYFQGDYEQEPVLAVLPGQWTHNDGYDTYYYRDYDVIPITFDIPMEEYHDDYGRSVETEGTPNTTPRQFLGVKEHLEGWQRNPKVWRPNSNSLEEEQRSADPFNKRHFHKHGLSHAHTFIHQHVFNPGQHQTQDTNYGQHATFGQSHTQAHTPIQHSSFSQAQAQAQAEAHAQSQSSGFSHQTTTLPIIPQTHGHQITINKQTTTVVVPQGGAQIAQVAGNNNAVSQSQATAKTHHDILPETNLNSQTAQVTGSHNSVTQSQASNQAPFLSRESEDLLRAPYLINVPRRRNFYRTHDDAMKKNLRKRSVDIDFKTRAGNALLEQNKFLKEMQGLAKDDKEVRFLTELGSNTLNGLEEQIHSIKKRTVPLLRLVADPNAKMDVPKTLENLGTVVRNSFENKRAPMYHLKNVASSAKDAFLSTLRIAPQDLFIPSRYKMVDREEEAKRGNLVESPNPRYTTNRGEQTLGAVNPNLLPRTRGSLLRERIRARAKQSAPAQEPEPPRESLNPSNFPDTFTRVGSMLRESVRSGQEALNHMGEMYHSARKALATTRYVAPRVLLSSMNIPSVQRDPPLFPRNDKFLMITPKILQLKQEAVGAPHYSEKLDDFVGVGNVMNSLGLSNPDAETVGLRRIVFHPANLGQPLGKPNFEARSNFAENPRRPVKNYHVLADTLGPEGNIAETLDALNNAREIVGASTFKDFVLQMKNGLSAFFKETLEEAKLKLNDELAARENNLKSKSLNNQFELKDLGKPKISPGVDETVGAGLLLPNELLKPFMGQPSKSERRKFFEEYGDSVESSEEGDKDHQVPANKTQTTPEIKELIGAINPKIFDENFQVPDMVPPSKVTPKPNTKPGEDNNSKKLQQVESTTEKVTESTTKVNTEIFNENFQVPETLTPSKVTPKPGEENNSKKMQQIKTTTEKVTESTIKVSTEVFDENFQVPDMLTPSKVTLKPGEENNSKKLQQVTTTTEKVIESTTKVKTEESITEVVSTERSTIKINTEEASEQSTDENTFETTEGVTKATIFNKIFNLCDEESPFKFVSMINVTTKVDEKGGESSESSEIRDHKCIYIKTTTEKSTEDTGKTTMATEDNPESFTGTTEVNLENITEKPNHAEGEATQTDLENVTEKSNRVEGEATQANFEKITENSNNAEGEASAVNLENVTEKPNHSEGKTIEGQGTDLSSTDSGVVGNEQESKRTSMKMGKALLTPFMGKVKQEEGETYFDTYNGGYEEPSGEYSGENEYLRAMNTKSGDELELQALSTDPSGRKWGRPFVQVGVNTKINVQNPLEQNVL